MHLFETDITLLILYLFALNFIGILLINSEERFWLPGILVWVGLFTILLVQREANRKELELADYTNSLTKNSEPKDEAADPPIKHLQIEETNSKGSRQNHTLFTLLGWQSVFCFFWSIIGFAKTQKNFYKKTMLVFLLLSLLYLALSILR